MKQLKKKGVLSFLVMALFAAALTAGAAAGKSKPSALFRYLEENRNTDTEVVVAVLDTGFTPGTVDSGRIFDCGPEGSREGEAAPDENGHGTKIAEIIAENSSSNIKILPIRVIDEDGATSAEAVAEGIESAVKNGAEIIHVSVAAVDDGNAERLAEAVREAAEKGVVVIAPAGDSGRNTAGVIPANSAEAIVVGAVGEDGTPHAASNYGNTVDFAAVAENSQEAAAYVSSVAASIKAIDPEADAEAVSEILKRFAAGNPAEGNGYVGNGVLSRTEGNFLCEDNSPDSLLDYRQEWKELEPDAFCRLAAESTVEEQAAFVQGLSEGDLETLDAFGSVLNSTILYTDNEGNPTEAAAYEWMRALKTDSSRYAAWPLESASGYFNLEITSYDTLEINKYKVVTWAMDGVSADPNHSFEAAYGIDLSETEINDPSYNISCKYTTCWTLDDGYSGYYLLPLTFTGKPVGYRMEYSYSFDFDAGNLIGTLIDHGGDEFVIYMDTNNLGHTSFGDGIKIHHAYVGYRLTLIRYQIEYGLNGGVNHPSNPSVYTVKDTTRPRVYPPTRPGYAFMGWYVLVDADLDTYYNEENYIIGPEVAYEEIPKESIGNRYYEASWQLETYTITYDMDDSADSPAVNDPGNPSSYTFLDDVTIRPPQREGYAFTGWVDKVGKEYGTSISWAAGTETGNKAYIATWKKVSEYTVTLEKGEGIDSVEGAGTYHAGDTVEINASVLEGYTWKNWTGYRTLEGKQYLFIMPAENVTFTANATRNSSALKVDPNGGVWDGSALVQTFVGKYGARLEIAAPTRRGHVFTGWTLTHASGGNGSFNEDGGIYTFGSANGGTDTLTAVWDTELYALELAKDDGVLSLQYSTDEGKTWKVYDTAVTIAYQTPLQIKAVVKDGYVWKDWTNQNRGGAEVSAERIYTFEDGMPAEDIFYMANTSSIRYTIHYEKGATDSTAPMPEDMEVTFGTDVTLAVPGSDVKGRSYKVIFDANTPAGTDGTPELEAAILSGYLQSAGTWEILGTDYRMGETLSKPDFAEKDGAVVRATAQWIPKELKDLKDAKLTGYTFGGWYTDAACSEGKKVDTVTINPAATAYEGTLYAKWTPNTYLIRFDGNGATDGSMEDLEVIYDTEAELPENAYQKENEHGFSTFLGWSTAPDSKEIAYTEKENIKNLLSEDGAVLTLYAVWDDCPGIEAKDLYYTLEQAQNGDITEMELLSQAKASDPEDGEILPGTHDDTGNSFRVMDYAETDFTQFKHSGSITETYRVIDSSGNSYKEQITVHVVDTSPETVVTTSDRTERQGTTRFINEKYYRLPYEKGGLEENSVWKCDPEYVAVIEDAFANLRNDTPERVFFFPRDTVLQMKEFIRVNGFGNTKSPDALQRFYDQFLAPNEIDYCRD